MSGPAAAKPFGPRLFRALFIVACLAAPGPGGAIPDMDDDFRRMMEWLSSEVVQGLAFDAGSTFDPPRELRSRRIQPDLSLGLGSVPLDKSRFPVPETEALKELRAADVFPNRVTFPNLTMHLRAGLPGRCDVALRGANMTTPPGYKISAEATGEGQSNSVGVSLRKHLLGGGKPLVTLGAHFNYVFGRFTYRSRFLIDESPAFTADADMTGTIAWNVRSYGLNAVVSDNVGMWTPFLGLGANFVRGSVRARLDAVPQTELISPIQGEASRRPEELQSRAIAGLQLNRSWANFFANGEIKTSGIGRGRTWVVHAGISLPFTIGARGGLFARAERSPRAPKELDAPRAVRAKRRNSQPEDEIRAVKARPARVVRPEMFGGPVKREESAPPEFIFIQ